MKKEKTYTLNTKIYLFLLLGAGAVTFGALFIRSSSKWFVITSGLGCGSIASVLVAWLIDAANCRQRKKQNDDLLRHLFDDFDICVKNELQNILYSCAKQDAKIKIEKKYTIAQIAEMLNEADGSLPIWDARYSNLGAAYTSVNAAILLAFDPTPQHRLYSLFEMCAGNNRAYQAISSNNQIKSNAEGSFPYLLLCTDLKCMEDIFSLRNLKVEIEIDPQTKEYMRKCRSVVEQNNQS